MYFVCALANWAYIFQGLNLDDFARGKLDLTSKELVEERQEALAVCQDSQLWEATRSIPIGSSLAAHLINVAITVFGAVVFGVINNNIP